MDMISKPDQTANRIVLCSIAPFVLPAKGMFLCPMPIAPAAMPKRGKSLRNNDLPGVSIRLVLVKWNFLKGLPSKRI